MFIQKQASSMAQASTPETSAPATAVRAPWAALAVDCRQIVAVGGEKRLP
jgi:hypothetical protein